MQGAAATESRFYSAQRRAMVDGQLRTFSVTDPAVVGAFLAVPREAFLPDALKNLAYSDAPLTLGAPGGPRRVLLQPMVLARLLQAAKVELNARALVVGGGTGYAACILAQFAAHVVTLDTDPAWAETVASRAAELGLASVRAVTGPLAQGAPDGAPYDVILVPGAVETRLGQLLDQLAPAGCLVTIEGRLGGATRRVGKAVAFRKIGSDVSVAPLFEATAPVIEEFREPAGFVF